MKKIAFVLQDLTGGGAERTVSNLSFELSKEYDFYIILFNGKEVSYPHKAKMIDLALPAKRSAIGKMINVIKRSRALKRLKRQYQFDVVVSFMFSASIANVLSRCNEYIVSSVRNYMSAYGDSFLNKYGERYVARKSDRIVAISEMVRQDMIKCFGVPANKIQTIYNPCDFLRLQNNALEPASYSFDSNAFYFITLGRLVHQKGHWNLLKAFSLFYSSHRNAKLLILGSGPLQGKLEDLAVSLGINNSVEFLGFQDNPHSYLAKSDVFVLSSLHEGLGNVLLEALACKVPIISTDCFAGPREILAPKSNFNSKVKTMSFEEYGVLVPEFNDMEDYTTSISEEQKEMASAMEVLFEDDAKRTQYKEKSIERVKDFSPNLISMQWKEFFDSIDD